jgi:cyclophilin family peptidyl-prolyl cis-trans isomerase
MSKLLLIVVPVIVVVVAGAWVWSTFNAQTLPAAVATSDSTTTDLYSSSVTTSATVAPTVATVTSTPITNTHKIMPNVKEATLHTNKGDITIEFYPAQAPNTVANFIKLAQSGFYDGTKFHRVIKGFMDQGGDPLTKDDSLMARWGTGGPGYQFNDEITPTNSNVAGSIAMANSGPNTQGSQFFINAVDNSSLNKGYTVFGHVVAGMSVVTAINNVSTDSSDRPLQPVVLTSVTLK